MFQLFYKYLILNKKAIIPGVGVFYIDRKSATLDFTNKIFVSPALQIGFNPNISDTDNRIYTFISNEQKIDEVKAITHFDAFTTQLKENLDKYREATLPGIGQLLQNAEGKLDFKAKDALKDHFPNVNAERILRAQAEHHVLVGDLSRTNTQMKEILTEEPDTFSQSKDYWWIFAVALGIIGIAAIVYYYLHNGSLQ